MTYDEWTKLSSEEMMAVGPDAIIQILKPLPWGYVERDEEVSAKLSETHSLVVVTSILKALGTSEKSNSVNLDSLTTQLYNLVPDDSHAQTFMLGQRMLKMMLLEYFELVLKKNTTNGQ